MIVLHRMRVCIRGVGVVMKRFSAHFFHYARYNFSFKHLHACVFITGARRKEKSRGSSEQKVDVGEFDRLCVLSEAAE